MSLFVRAGIIAFLGIALASCGGSDTGDSPDEDAIQDVFSDFFKAFEDEDAGKLAGLLADECDDPEQRAADAIDGYVEESGGQEVDYEVTGVEFRELTQTTASARPVGVIRTGDGEFPLGDETSEYASFEKIDGEWKFTDCNILF